MADPKAWLQELALAAYANHVPTVRAALEGRVDLSSMDDWEVAALARHATKHYGSVGLTLTESLDHMLKTFSGSGEGFSISADILGETKTVTVKWVWR